MLHTIIKLPSREV